MTQPEEKQSAMRREFLKVRQAHPGKIIFWQRGDFFETFEDDAKLVSTELDLQLTTGSFGKLKVPMAGVPVSKVWTYAQRLVERNYHVVMVEERQGAIPAHQREDRRQQDRVVTRILTPGTLVEPELLDARTRQYLVAVLVDRDAAGLAACDVSTGAFIATELHGPDAHERLVGEIQRLQAAEILVPEDERLRLPGLTPTRRQLAHDLAPTSRRERERLLPSERRAQIAGTQPVGDWLQGRVTAWPAWRWDRRTAADALKGQFRTASLAGFGLEDRPLAVRAAGAILQYLQETHPDGTNQIERVRWYSPDAFMFLDPQTRRNLELLASQGAAKQGALIDVLDQTRTPMGARVLRQWVAEPLTELAPLLARQAAVARFVDDLVLRVGIRDGLHAVGDLERTTARVLQGSATPRDLERLRAGLRAVPELARLLGAGRIAAAHDPWDLVLEDGASIDPCADVLDLLERALAAAPPAMLGGWDPMEEEHVICRGYDATTEQIVQASAAARGWIAGLEAHERAATELKGLRVEYTAGSWAIILPTNTPPRLLPAHYREVVKRGSEWRFTTPELEEYDAILAGVRFKLNALEREVFATLVVRVAAAGERLRATARALAEVDVQATLADVASRGRYVRPELHTGTELQIVQGRHPVVEQTLEEDFVPNDTAMDTEDAQLLIITGPNMAGKSTYLRQVALIVLLAQIGAYVPADSARIGLVDRIFTRIGAQDDLATGQSTFMVEMSETANILHHATRRSLIVLDELGRGTSTYDGLALAYAVLEYLHEEPELGARTLFATHFHELTRLADRYGRVRNYHVAVAEADDHVVFLRGIVPGPAERSFGIHVAQMAGIPERVVQRAAQVLAALEKRGAREQQRAALEQLATLDGAVPEVEAPSEAVEAAPPPAARWSSAVFNRLDTVDVDELTPMEALALVQELKQLRQHEPDERDNRRAGSGRS